MLSDGQVHELRTSVRETIMFALDRYRINTDNDDEVEDFVEHATAAVADQLGYGMPNRLGKKTAILWRG